MRFDRLHKGIAYAISGLGLYALSLGGDIGGGAWIVLVAGYVTSFFLDGPYIKTKAWTRTWNVVLLLGLGVQIVRIAAGGGFLPRLVEFAAFLQVSRLFTRRSAIEYQQIAVLSFLHLIAATVLSSELAYGITFIGFVILTPWMLTLSHLRREIERHYPERAERDRPALDAARVLGSRRIVNSSFFAGTAMLALPIFFITAGLFLVFPRVGSGFLQFSRNPGRRVAGFGSDVELGGFGVIRDDPTIVMRVTPLSKLARVPQSLGMRFRGTSFDAYDGHKWTRSMSRAERFFSSGDDIPLIRYPNRDHDIAFRVDLDPLDEPVLFLPEGTIALNVPSRLEGSQERLRSLMRSTGLDIRYQAGESGGMRYSVWVDPMQHASDPHELDKLEREVYLYVPPGHERVVELARRLTENASTATQKAGILHRYLRQDGRFRYSLEQPDTRGKLPLNVFLFEARAGHCEYFATALAIMLRASGVPARNVTGFVGGTLNPYGGYYAVRQGDAHSWVEAYVEGTGWVTYDPTPSAGTESAVPEGPFASVEAFFDAMRTRWQTSVVGYDLRAQVGFLQRLSRWMAQLERTRRDGSGGGSSDGPSGKRVLQSVGKTLGALVVLGALIALGVVITRRVRQRREERASGRHVPTRQAALDAIALYRELEDSLSRRGAPRPADRTPLAHAAALEARAFEGAEAVREITTRYLAVRFGGEDLPKAEQIQLLARARAVGKAPQSLRGNGADRV